MQEVILPPEIDYIGIYLTARCFLSCPYCITNQGAAFINTQDYHELTPPQWIEGLNRLRLPKEVPLTFEGGEPFLYKGIWQLLEKVRHKIDILTALPKQVTKDKFRALRSLDWNKRPSPYPTIRVSYHHGQNDYHELVERIRDLQDIVSIGLFHIEHPGYPQLTDEIRKYAKAKDIEFRTKAFLGDWNGKIYGQYKYPDACCGKASGKTVKCKNTVFPIAPDGNIYRCHSDLYDHRNALKIGNILDPDLKMTFAYRTCANYGRCSPCDIKIKTNHLQQFGYTSVDLKFQDE